ncbi:MAG: tRNA (adenosine(37)-N6)-threonylcarbamoyltransferase complex dimerization subunit type 1 TsaB [Pseudomonadota bacterium]
MGSNPTILAFDTSAAHCAAALLSGGQIVAEAREEMARGQAERLTPMLQDLLDQQGVVWREIDAIGVGTGPGNFTGIRVSVATARGLSLGLGIPAIGVSAFEALLGNEGLAIPGPQLVSLAQPRREGFVMVQLFENGRASGLPFEQQVLRSDGPSEPPKLPEGTRFVGAEAAALHRIFAERRGWQGSIDLPAPAHPASAIAPIAAARFEAGWKGPRPAPIYIRPPDAAPAKDAPPVMLA